VSQFGSQEIDNFDFVFINKPLSEKEDKEFSDFLKNRNKKVNTPIRSSCKIKKELA
jgi:hypothetical protein